MKKESKGKYYLNNQERRRKDFKKMVPKVELKMEDGEIMETSNFFREKSYKQPKEAKNPPKQEKPYLQHDRSLLYS